MKTPPVILFLTFALGAASLGAKIDTDTTPAKAPAASSAVAPDTGAAFNTALREELLAMAEEDQRVRTSAGTAMTRDQIDEMRRVDLRNEARLREIVAEHSWPGKSLVGEDGSSKAWLVVQHCELEFQEECLPLLERAVVEGEAAARDHAYLLDRVRMRRGDPQVYGTQFRTFDGETSVYPIENPDGVDARRRAIGLPPLAEQMKRMGVAPSRSPQFDEALRAELAAMAAADRRDAGLSTPPDQVEERKRLHAQRVKRLKEIVAQHGWPGRSLVGTDGAFNAWLLVQNCEDPSFIEQCLPLLDRAVAAGEANARSYAYLLDSVRTSQGKPQVYGTQLTSSADGRLALHPIENRSQVNERRRAVGLEPIEDYERRMRPRSN